MCLRFVLPFYHSYSFRGNEGMLFTTLPAPFILTKSVSYFSMKIAGVIFQINFNCISQLAKKKEKKAFLVLFFKHTRFIFTVGSLHLGSALSQNF